MEQGNVKKSRRYFDQQFEVDVCVRTKRLNEV